MIREFCSSSAFFATLDIFLCLPFANTTDCMSPSSINIWWYRTLKVMNKDSGLCHHPSQSFCMGKSAGPMLQAQRPHSCSLFIYWPSIFNLLRSDDIGLRNVALLIPLHLTILKNGQQMQVSPPKYQKEMICSSCREFKRVR